MTVENLEINVKTNAGDSANAFKSLKSALQGVSGASVKLTSASNGVKKIGEEAKKSEKQTNKLWSSIKRIAMYRLLRTVIKEITQAFSEGLKAAYAFSAGLTTEGNRFADALDSMKSATNQMKGQLGSALIGLLTAITPILEKIIDLVVKVADVMSQFFAAFTGSTYLRAIRTQAEFADITASGAKSAKEWKNQLLGFDEINKLNEPSGSGTGVNLLEGYAFEDAPISEGISRFVEKIKQKFAELKESFDFTNLREAFGRLKESLDPIVDKISNGLSWAWNNVLVPFEKWRIEEAAPALIDALAAAFDFLDAVLDALAPVLEPLWENVLKPFFKACGEVIVTGLQELTDLLHDLADLVRGNIGWEEFIGNLDAVKIALLGVGSYMVITGISTLTTKISGLLSMSVGGSALMKAAIAGLVIYAGIKLGELIDIIGQLIKANKELNKANENELNKAQDNYSHLLETCGKETADQYAWMVHSIDTTNMTLAEAQAAIAQQVKDTQNGVKREMQNSAQDFKSIGEQCVENLNQGFSRRWKDFMSTLASKYAEFRQATQQGLSVGSVSVTTSGYSVTNPSKYAAGGLPDTGELFIANERGPELVGNLNGHSAVANNDQIEVGIEEAAYRGFIRAIASTGGNNKGGDFVLNINGREFARATYKDYQAAARETGGSLINNFA